MIFIDGKRKQDFKDEIAELKKVFPNSFDQEYNQPIQIKRSMAGSAFAEVYKPSVTDRPVGRRKLVSPSHWASCKGKFQDPSTNLMHDWRYSSTLPSYDKSGEPVFRGEQIEIKDGMVVNPAEIEKLVMLYFYCPLLRNGKKNRKSAAFEFVIPAVEAQQRIEKVSIESKYANEILIEGSRKDYGWIKAVYNTLSLSPNNIESEDRVQLYDLVVRDVAMRERYERAKVNIDALGKNDGAKVVNDINDLITSLNKAKRLVEEGGFWVVKDDNGLTTKTLAQVTGAKIQEKRLALTEFLLSNPTDLDSLKSIVVE